MDSELLQQVRLGGAVPGHVAVIMDGNGRWAQRQGLPRYEGHRRGMKAVREVVEASVESGVGILTLFAFSTENWRRPPTEIGALMTLLRVYAQRELRTLRDQGVEVRVLGELGRLDDDTRRAVEEISRGTEGGTSLRLNLMISYSGRDELLRAVRTLAARAAAGELDPAEIGPETVESVLFTAGLPDPDLLIRTSGEQRLSNFLLWQLAYTEIHTSAVLWPDFTREDYYRALLDFQSRERRFGGVQVS
ncbi:MAG TPA: polyprenyl diphosphate synthase [Longimicrobiales bacterium]|nr:polyprenyl diphosphate synthase [Longimicrobiales bacterium]